MDSPVARIAELRSAIAEGPLVPSVKHPVARRTGQKDWAKAIPPLTTPRAAQIAALEPLLPAIAAA